MLNKKGTQVPFARAPADVGARVLGYRYSSQFFFAWMGRKIFKKIFLKSVDSLHLMGVYYKRSEGVDLHKFFEN